MQLIDKQFVDVITSDFGRASAIDIAHLPLVKGVAPRLTVMRKVRRHLMACPLDVTHPIVKRVAVSVVPKSGHLVDVEEPTPRTEHAEATTVKPALLSDGFREQKADAVGPSRELPGPERFGQLACCLQTSRQNSRDKDIAFGLVRA